MSIEKGSINESHLTQAEQLMQSRDRAKYDVQAVLGELKKLHTELLHKEHDSMLVLAWKVSGELEAGSGKLDGDSISKKEVASIQEEIDSAKVLVRAIKEKYSL